MTSTGAAVCRHCRRHKRRLASSCPSAMILCQLPSPRHHVQSPAVEPSALAAPVPTWLRRAVPDPQILAAEGFGLEDVVIAAGAAFGALYASRQCAGPVGGGSGWCWQP